MQRPTLLVAEQEPEQALSVRKLVLETAKFNVLTAHSTAEALDIFHSFPNISAAVVATGGDIDCNTIGQAIRGTTEKIPIICLSPQIGARYAFAHHTVSSHEPQELLNVVRALLGDPRTLPTDSK